MCRRSATSSIHAAPPAGRSGCKRNCSSRNELRLRRQPGRRKLMTTLQGNAAAALLEKDPQRDPLTARLESVFAHPERSANFDLHAGVDDVLKDVGLSTSDSGGTLTFYGQDPIIASPFRFGTMAALGLAAKAVAIASLWQLRTGEGQDIALDVRKALRRFAGFFDLKWETI